MVENLCILKENQKNTQKENLCITDSWPSVFMVPLHLEFIQPCRTAIFNMKNPCVKRTHAIQTSIVKGSTLLLLFLPFLSFWYYSLVFAINSTVHFTYFALFKELFVC